MKVGIMQPYFFPYLGYFSLIKHTDRFILLDEVQFIRHGWIERNRVLKQNTDWLYIKVPILKEGRETIIKDVKINNSNNWKQAIISQLAVYKRIAPNYHSVIGLVNSIFEHDYYDMVSLNNASLQMVCNYLNITADINVFSEMGLTIDQPNEPDDWALNICKAIGGVNEYWNPPGGKSFFDKSKYRKENIEIRFQQLNLSPYNQRRVPFIPGLSIIDVMMFNSVAEINLLLDDYKFL